MQKSKLTEADFKDISKMSGLSTLTIRKWYMDPKSVRIDTQDKIINAWIDVSNSRLLNIDSEIEKMETFVSRLDSIIVIYKKTRKNLVNQITHNQSYNS